jgi:hypothetical protein
VIIYSHPNSVQPPAFLVGARDLVTRQHRDGYAYGVGPAWLVGEKPANAIELSDGWCCWVAGVVDPFVLNRELPGIPVLQVADEQGRIWHAPMAIDTQGVRMFRTAYGRDFKPVIQPWQQTLIDYALSARAELGRFAAGNADTRAEMMPLLGNWTAFALAQVNHISSEAIIALGLLDDRLVNSTLCVLSSYIPAGVDDAGTD